MRLQQLDQVRHLLPRYSGWRRCSTWLRPNARRVLNVHSGRMDKDSLFLVLGRCLDVCELPRADAWPTPPPALELSGCATTRAKRTKRKRTIRTVKRYVKCIRNLTFKNIDRLSNSGIASVSNHSLVKLRTIVCSTSTQV